MIDFIEQQSSSYYFLQSTLHAYEKLCNVNSLTAIDNYRGYRRKLSYLFSNDPETRPFLTDGEKEDYSFSKLLQKILLGILCFGIAGFASWLYWDDSRRAAHRFQIQLGDDFIWFCLLVRYCCSLINLFLNIEVEILIMVMLYEIFNQPIFHRQLMGMPNPILFLMSIPIAIFAELPFVKLALISAPTSGAETIDIFSAIDGLPNYVYGATFILMGTKLIFFSKTIDNSVRSFNHEEKKLLREARDILVNKVSTKVETILNEYQTGNFNTLNSIRNQLIFIRDKNNNSGHVPVRDLKNLFREMGFFDKNLQILPPAVATYEPRWKKIIPFIKRNFACEKENLKAKSKLFFYTAIIVAAAVTVINDIMTGFFATYDVFQSPFDQIFFALFVGLFTFIASGGFTQAAITSLLSSHDPNIAKMMHRRTYYTIAALLVFIGIFSGGPSGLEGYLAFLRLLPKVLFLVYMAEILGFCGGVPSNIAFALKCLQRFILKCVEIFGDENDKRLVAYINCNNAFADDIAQIKLSQVRILLQRGIFGNPKDVGIPEDTQKWLNSEHPSDMTYLYQTIP